MKVPAGLYVKTQMMLKLKRLYHALGNVESAILHGELADQDITSPVYVTSLARSGTTIVTEILSQLSPVCSHTYADFPGVFTPYWNNWLRQKRAFLKEKKIERSHQDRILINNASPEAFEEVLWMHAYPKIHHKGYAEPVNVKHTDKFVEYYRQHIKKHLLVKNKSRYVSKANYNINRISQILTVFADAKFIVPVRHPVNHIASLMKQHEMYLKAAKNSPRIDKQLAASGHFEFGNLREVVRMSKTNYAQKVQQLWRDGQELSGWSHYWSGLYQAVYELKKTNQAFDNAIHFVKYEDLCLNSCATIEELLKHCQLIDDDLDWLKAHYHNRLSLPEYYQHHFNQKHITEILQITSAISEKFGYNDQNFN